MKPFFKFIFCFSFIFCLGYVSWAADKDSDVWSSDGEAFRVSIASWRQERNRIQHALDEGNFDLISNDDLDRCQQLISEHCIKQLQFDLLRRLIPRGHIHALRFVRGNYFYEWVIYNGHDDLLALLVESDQLGGLNEYDWYMFIMFILEHQALKTFQALIVKGKLHGEMDAKGINAMAMRQNRIFVYGDKRYYNDCTCQNFDRRSCRMYFDEWLFHNRFDAALALLIKYDSLGGFNLPEYKKSPGQTLTFTPCPVAPEIDTFSWRTICTAKGLLSYLVPTRMLKSIQTLIDRGWISPKIGFTVFNQYSNGLKSKYWTFEEWILDLKRPGDCSFDDLLSHYIASAHIQWRFDDIRECLKTCVHHKYIKSLKLLITQFALITDLSLTKNEHNWSIHLGDWAVQNKCYDALSLLIHYGVIGGLRSHNIDQVVQDIVYHAQYAYELHEFDCIIEIFKKHDVYSILERLLNHSTSSHWQRFCKGNYVHYFLTWFINHEELLWMIDGDIDRFILLLKKFEYDHLIPSLERRRPLTLQVDVAQNAEALLEKKRIQAEITELVSFLYDAADS